VHTDDGAIDAEPAVIALGRWSKKLVDVLGYRLPLLAIHGYHRPLPHGRLPQIPMVAADSGDMMSPMRQGQAVQSCPWSQP